MDLKALLIDQDLDDRAIINKTLSDIGFEVDLGITSFDALNYLKTNEYDLLVCNNLMPTLNEGLEFLSYIKTNKKDLYTIICSDIKEIKILREFIEQGVADYIIKPIDIDIFVSKIAFKFDSVEKKEFASIGISEDDKENVCIIELETEIIQISELYIDLKLSDEIALKTKFFIPGDVFAPVGITKENIEIEVFEIATDRIRCKYLNFTDVELAMVREWVLENHLL